MCAIQCNALYALQEIHWSDYVRKQQDANVAWVGGKPTHHQHTHTRSKQKRKRECVQFAVEKKETEEKPKTKKPMHKNAIDKKSAHEHRTK